ncbi:site-specific tyrosine recombinase XerC [uncultured Microbulbifer sp.]|uniref:site-specific tyrosine recombinase XerC n=1 Tax=uncultured Microbulbifer sp. TaxID=348147 RepID=UPI002623EB18|nr:site-specific tyrosine recombinase XerC [uncultured Microbulbifer sp.]
MPYLERTPKKPSDPRALEAYALAYKEQLQARHYASQSVQYKHAALGWFIDWCHERGVDRIEQITRPVLQRYQRHLYHAISRTGKPLSVVSQRNRLTAVRTWFKFLIRENLILYNPASELELPKAEKRLPKHTLTTEEAELVLSQPDIETDQGIRDRAMLEVLYSTGIRRQEVINLALPDINTGAGILSVRQGKGKKDRFVPIGERALIWIDRYLETVRPQYSLPSSPDAVFLDENGKQLDPHKVSRAVKKYVKQSGIDKVGSCHLFRHTMATLMLENGADIRFIQQMLGHAMLSTTEIYTHVAIHKLKEIHTATHPARADQYHNEGKPEPSESDLLATLAAEAAEETGEG